MDLRAAEELRAGCVRLIRAHFTDPALSPSWLADQLHVSRRQLDRCFEGVGPGTNRQIAHRRLAAVAHVLRARPDLSVHEVAVLCGYTTYETLRSQARSILGRTPGQLRDLGVGEPTRG